MKAEVLVWIMTIFRYMPGGIEENHKEPAIVAGLWPEMSTQLMSPRSKNTKHSAAALVAWELEHCFIVGRGRLCTHLYLLDTWQPVANLLLVQVSNVQK
jgi:hypothetical protein